MAILDILDIAFHSFIHCDVSSLLIHRIELHGPFCAACVACHAFEFATFYSRGRLIPRGS